MRSLPHVLARLRTLSSRELWLLLRVTGFLLVLPPLLKWLPLPRLMRLVDPGPVVNVPRLPPPARIIELTQRLLDQRVGIFRPSCLRQSLVLYRLLRQAGIPAIIRFGVSKEGEDIAGHCWLEEAGGPLAEKADPHQTFAVIYSFPETVNPG